MVLTGSETKIKMIEHSEQMSTSRKDRNIKDLFFLLWVCVSSSELLGISHCHSEVLVMALLDRIVSSP